jgi:dienelactone hydrolase
VEVDGRIDAEVGTTAWTRYDRSQGLRQCLAPHHRGDAGHRFAQRPAAPSGLLPGRARGHRLRGPLAVRGAGAPPGRARHRPARQIPPSARPTPASDRPEWRARKRSRPARVAKTPPRNGEPGSGHEALTERTTCMDTVSRRVSFPSGGETLAGTLFTPPGPPDGPLPAVVVAGGQTCVKEQMAERLAARGYAALAFDFRGFGESTGAPRDYESPSRKVEDLHGALTFLTDQPGLDPGRLAALGIGVGAGYVAVEAASDRRVRALALVAPGLCRTPRSSRPASATPRASPSASPWRGRPAQVPRDRPGRLRARRHAWRPARDDRLLPRP